MIGLPPHDILEKGIARTFQNLRLFTNLTVMENVLVGQHARLNTGPCCRRSCARPRRAGRRERRRADWAMEIFAHLRQPAGAARRADGDAACPTPTGAVSRSPARWPPRPRMLLLDEPTAGMNPAETLELAEQIKSLQRSGPDRPADRAQAGRRHRAWPTRSMCSTMATMIAEGKPDEVRRNEEVLRAYLGRNAAGRRRGEWPEPCCLNSRTSTPTTATCTC